MVSDAQKKASAKWDKENMVVLACKVKRETAEQFKAACAAQGTTSNAVLQQAVKAYLEEHPAQVAGSPISRTFLSFNKRECYTRYREVWLPVQESPACPE